MGGTLKWIGPAPITDPDPVTIYDQGGIVLVYQFLEYLIDLNNDNSLVAKLAESWTPNDTRRRVDLQASLRRHVQRRQPLRAEDVVTSMERVLDPDGGSGALVAARRRALARRHQGRRRPHRRVHPRQAVRRLPVHGVVRQLQHRHPAAHLQGRHHQEPGRHRPVHARSVHAQAEGDVQEEPHLLGQGRAGSSAAVPGRPSSTSWSRTTRPQNLQLQSGAVDFQPQTVFQGAQALFAAIPTCASTSTPAPASARSRSTPGRAVERRQRQGAPPGRRLLPRPRRHQQGAVRRPQQPRLRHLLGADGVRRQPAPPEPRAQDYDKAKQLLTDAGFADGIKIELTVAKYLENPQLAQLIQEQCKPAGITVDDRPAQLRRVLRRRRRRLLRHHAVDQRAP